MKTTDQVPLDAIGKLQGSLLSAPKFIGTGPSNITPRADVCDVRFFAQVLVSPRLSSLFSSPLLLLPPLCPALLSSPAPPLLSTSVLSSLQVRVRVRVRVGVGVSESERERRAVSEREGEIQELSACHRGERERERGCVRV